VMSANRKAVLAPFFDVRNIFLEHVLRNPAEPRKRIRRVDGWTHEGLIPPLVRCWETRCRKAARDPPPPGHAERATFERAPPPQGWRWLRRYHPASLDGAPWCMKHALAIEKGKPSAVLFPECLDGFLGRVRQHETCRWLMPFRADRCVQRCARRQPRHDLSEGLSPNPRRAGNSKVRDPTSMRTARCARSGNGSDERGTSALLAAPHVRWRIQWRVAVRIGGNVGADQPRRVAAQ
jgi:hypothetical protein